MKTSELTNRALDWAVGTARGLRMYLPSEFEEFKRRKHGEWLGDCNYSSDWRLGGPIIEREIDNLSRRDGYFYAQRFKRHTGRVDMNFKSYPDEKESWAYGPTLLVAAMRCYVASKLGDEVNVSKELL